MCKDLTSIADLVRFVVTSFHDSGLPCMGLWGCAIQSPNRAGHFQAERLRGEEREAILSLPCTVSLDAADLPFCLVILHVQGCGRITERPSFLFGFRKFLPRLKRRGYTVLHRQPGITVSLPIAGVEGTANDSLIRLNSRRDGGCVGVNVYVIS